MVGWHHWLNGHEFEQVPPKELVVDREAWHAAVHGTAKSWVRLSELNWTKQTEFVQLPQQWWVLKSLHVFQGSVSNSFLKIQNWLFKNQCIHMAQNPIGTKGFIFFKNHLTTPVPEYPVFRQATIMNHLSTHSSRVILCVEYANKCIDDCMCTHTLLSLNHENEFMSVHKSFLILPYGSR